MWKPIHDAPSKEYILATIYDEDKEWPPELIEMIIVETSGNIFNVNSGNYSKAVFTHWMPLPSPPETVEH